MMTPVDILIESIQAASIYGDSPGLRRRQSEKLEEALVRQEDDPGD